MDFQLAGLCFTDAAASVFSHDASLVALAYAIAAAGVYAALEMIQRCRTARGAMAHVWCVAAAATLGGSVWSMHATAMLALQTTLLITYDPVAFVLSLVVSVGSIGCALRLLRQGGTALRILQAGVIVGLGVSAMHYIGMAALRLPGTIAYRPGLWASSVAFSVVIATISAAVLLHPQRSWQRGLAALLISGGICGVHFIGMAATVVRPDVATPYNPGFSGSSLAAAAAATIGILVLGAMLLIAADRRMLALARREAEQLRLVNEQLAAAYGQLQLRQQQFDALLDNMTQGVCFFDGGQRLLVANRRYGEIYNLPPEAIMPGRLLEEVVKARQAAGTAADMPTGDYLGWRQHIASGHVTSTTVVSLRNGRVVAICHQPMPDGGWVATHEDITERQQAESSMRFMARHDNLTELPNRLLFNERLDAAIGASRPGRGCAVLCLDLDHFKRVNDTLGHAVGDSLLQAVAARLHGCVRELDTVARLGGDEFAIIQRSVDGPIGAEVLSSHVVDALKEPFDIDGHRILIGVSIGIALTFDPLDAATKLLKGADIALYSAKTDGRGMVRFFEADMDARLQTRRRLETDLDGAIGRNEFELHYQPLVSLATSRVVGFEALVRWRHPVRGLVPPGEFVGVAEETGLIVPLGEWVLRSACFEAENWPPDISVAVNLSPIQFTRGNLIDAVKAALDASGMRPDRLELEITESVLLQDTTATLAALHELRQLGVTVALDDFGTGYSSLSYLRSFPFDKLKIDQSFVRDMAHNADAVSIVRAVIGLGRSLGIRTTAEGIETIEQLAMLRDEGCTEGQGYVFSRPKPAADLPMLIDRLHRTGAAAL